MVYIVTALGSEARPFIEYYNLSYVDDPHFRLYGNEDITLIISGVGKIRSAIATSYILSGSEDLDRSAIMNVGICGAYNTDYIAGTPVLINKICDMDTGYEYFPDILYNHDMLEGALETYARVISKEIDPELDLGYEKVFVDMEGSGFFEAASTFLPPHRISCIKVISDHLEGDKISRENVSDMIGNSLSNIHNIYEYIKYEIEDTIEVLNSADKDFLDDIVSKLNLTRTQRYKLYDIAFKYKLRTGKELPSFDYIFELQIENKREAKEEFERIKKRFWD